jgi:anti-sigma factor RsiW
MRCRKVRSLLSAASSDELDVRRQAAVREHLASCGSCRKEASYHTAVRQAIGQVPQKSVSQDFNTRLLDKIAHERFQQTRTRAYLPHGVPVLSWRALVPVAVTAVLALVAIYSFNGSNNSLSGSVPSAQLPTSMDDRYLTIQPTSNHKAAIGMENDWSLKQQLARSERMEAVSREMTNRYGFGDMYLTSASTPMGVTSPATNLSRTQRWPVYRIYRVTGGANNREGAQAY